MEQPKADLSTAPVVLIVPPFAPLFQANIACHLLQACARREGIDVMVVYANVLFASLVRVGEYERMLDERLRLEYVFREAAFGPDPGASATVNDSSSLRDGARQVEPFFERLTTLVGLLRPSVVGCTCSFEQISASLAILGRCKEIDPSITTIIGGANCEGEMAEGIVSLGGRIDYVVSGESEFTFPRLLEHLRRGEPHPDRIVRGEPHADLDQLPEPDYQEFFDQFTLYLPDQEVTGTSVAVPYESSRGCWWGMKHHCTFCGLNGDTMAFREKSPDVVASQMRRLAEAYPNDRINAVDNIMPYGYYQTLLPKLADTLPPDTSIFYEQKSNIDLTRAIALKSAHITAIQPGIESLNSHVLACMDKGVQAHQNIALLRYGRSLSIDITWNLLAGLPGERTEDYEEMADLLPHIVHLQPPDGMGFVRLDRFSPYYERAEEYGITNVRPKQIYMDIFPYGTDYDRLAYYFDGDYPCGAFDSPELMHRIAQQVLDWRERWTSRVKPTLAVVRLIGDEYVLVDDRGVEGEPKFEVIDAQTARVLLAGAAIEERDNLSWAIERGLMVEIDDRLVPLATAPQEILVEFVPHRSGDQIRLGAGLPAMVEFRGR